MGLRRIEYLTELMMFCPVSPAYRASVLAGERDAEVLAWGR